jgi:oligopeptide transport system substrate-binding protein
MLDKKNHHVQQKFLLKNRNSRTYFLALILLAALFILSCTAKKPDRALHLVMLENPKSLDPAQAIDALAAEAIGNVYETPLQYHYLKRPYELVPLLLEKMPEYSKDGLTVTLKFKHGVHFQDDPCFKNSQGRELIAEDFIYSLMRVADPKNLSDGWWTLDGKIKGLNEWRAESAKKSSTDYSTPISGLQALDRYTVQIKLEKKYPQLNYILAMTPSSVVSREAVEKYGPEFSNHPVGTGPFIISEYIRSSHITYEKNKTFHGENFPLAEARTPASDPDCFTKPRLATPTPKPKFDPLAGCKTGLTDSNSLVQGVFDYGKALPLTDKIVLHIFLERQPAWLEFMKGSLDYMVLPKDNFDSAIGADHLLKPELREKGIRLSKDDSSTEWFIGFNMEDPLIGTNKNLRKAIGYAYNSQKDIDLFTNGVAKASNQILPPTINGWSPKIAPREFNLEKAKLFLAKAGFPDGKNLPTLTFDVQGDSQDRQRGEFFKSQMAQVGINVDIRTNTRPQLFDRRKKGQVQIEMDGWIADYPDAENYLQLLFGPNKSPGPNNSSFNDNEFNKLYESVAGMSPSIERQKLIDQMTEIFLEKSPWIPNWVATLYHLHQDRLKNYVYSDFSYNNYKYYRLETE